MCAIFGYGEQKQITQDNEILEKISQVLKKRGPDDTNYYITNNYALGHTRLSIIDLKNGMQPMKKTKDNNIYSIVYNGELYNTEELKYDLINKGYSFDTNSDTEVILTSYIEYKEKCPNLLNGIFSFVVYDPIDNSIFLCRDHLGIKPLFYTITPENKIIFSSEIKGILCFDEIERILDKQGLMELIGLGPAHTPGITYFKNILEIKAGHYAKYKEGVFEEKKYWDLETRFCDDNVNTAIEKIKSLVEDSTKKQLVSDVGISSMLSGGIDSSILTYLANKNLNKLDTYSIDFIDNDLNFVSNDYQSSQDSIYVAIMEKLLKTSHHNILIDKSSLYELLVPSLVARDVPGMADIDSSMYAFCESIAKDFKVCISGECSDEIFGGYPWYYKDHLFNFNSFPWALSKKLRSEVIKKELLNDGELEEYINYRYTDTLKKVVRYDNEDDFNYRFRQINYLTIKWFMNTLLERTDRMSMSNSLEVRVPYADYRIFEYVYNLPAKMKLGLIDGNEVLIEKYLLRKAFENDLPKEIIARKKSPFPKTYDPKYMKTVEGEMLKILNDEKSKIHEIINKENIIELINCHGINLKENWFGQLMTYPQTLAYLIQIENWLQIYNISIQI